MQAVLPECRVTNFTTDWNSGIHLSALVDYCEPGLMPHWRHLDPNSRLVNSSEHCVVKFILETDIKLYNFSIHFVNVEQINKLMYWERNFLTTKWNTLKK